MKENAVAIPAGLDFITVPLSKVKPNEKNPRIIKDKKFFQLVESIKTFPQMLKIRPIVVDENMVVLGGNMRLKACKEAGLKEIPIIRANDLSEEQKREFIIKDNVGFGEWDWEQIANEWDSNELNTWGMDVPEWKVDESETDGEEPKEEMKGWFLSIRVNNEHEAQVWYERLIKEGLDVKIVT
jgi:hypothetical protein